MRKLLISILAVGISAAFIYGATMAWFTAEAGVEAVTFTAGTVSIDADTPVSINPANYDNVNPGDTFTATWTFVNDGTKDVKIRVKPSYLYDVAELNPVSNIVNITLSNGWIEKADGYLYYEPAVTGTYNVDPTLDRAGNLAARTVVLTVAGTFDGSATNNDYQGAKLTVEGTIQAIQASHSGEGDGEEGGWLWEDFDSYNS